jgi:uncharacterized protein YdiU (UPF0061 family)
MAISGETIDYGPCAFMEAFDPATVFSSIDHAGRYAYGNQPPIAQWNLARLAETLIALLHVDTEQARAAAIDVLQSFPARYQAAFDRGLAAKLGLSDATPDDAVLADDALRLLQDERIDMTSFFRALSSSLLGDASQARSLFDDPAPFDAWAARWRARLATEAATPEATAEAMNRVNPAYIPRNHLVEEALEAGTAGDLAPFRALLDAVTRPYDERPGLEAFAAPAPSTFGRYRTFCGT